MESDLNSQLVSSARVGNLEQVLGLLEKGADINFRDTAGHSALHVSLWWKRRDIVERLLNEGADFNVTDRDGKTVLIRAVIQGDLLLVNSLLNRGATIDAVDATYGRTALMQASLHDDAEAVALLLRRGANPNIQDNDGHTAEALADRWGKRKALKVFLDFRQSSKNHHSRPKIETESDTSPLSSPLRAMIKSEKAPIESEAEPPVVVTPSVHNTDVRRNHNNFQASSSQQGDAFAQMCNAHLKAQGFDLRGPRYLKEAGVEIDQVAINRCKAPIYFEFKGSTMGKRPGMLRTDTTKKAIANAFLLDRLGVKPFVVLTSHKLKEGSGSDAMIKTAGNTVLEVLCLMEPDDMKRLKWYLDTPATSVAPKPVNEKNGDLANGSQNIDISESALIMIDNRGGRFEEDDCWEEIMEFLQWGSGNPCSDPELEQPLKDRFFSALDGLCERGFLEKKDLRRVVASWVLTEKGINYLRERAFIV